MAGKRLMKMYWTFAVIYKILTIFIVISLLPVAGEDEEIIQFTENREKIFPSTILKDVDGEVDIEDVEDDFQERRRAYFSYQTFLDSDSVGFNKSSDQITEYSRNTALATVYGQTGDSDAQDSVHENTLKAKTKPVKVKVSCLGVDQNVDTEPSSIPNSTTSPELAFLVNINRNDISRTVEIVNATKLLNEILFINPSIKSRANPSNCSVILFYARWCPFSAKAAPHFNALARAFPSVRTAAVDSSMYPTVNTYFGILSVPTVILFHNGKIIAKFNDTLFTLNRFADFIQNFSDLKSSEKINVTSQDFHGPLPSSPIKEIDYYLYIAWIFIIICFFHYVSKSSVWNKMMDLVRTTWREAEAHHEHDD